MSNINIHIGYVNNVTFQFVQHINDKHSFCATKNIILYENIEVTG